MSKKLLALSLLLLAGAGCAASEPVADTNTAASDTGAQVADGSDTAASEGESGDAAGGTQLAEGEEGAGVVVDAGTGADGEVIVGGDAVAPTVKEFAVSGDNFAFAPSTITVNKGDTVRIVFTNAEGFHDWKIDEFNAATNKIGAGATETIEFVADKEGSFEYYCSVGSHRAMGMKGTLIVE